MRRWISWASAIYPVWWRRRYGDEFAALLEEVEPGWRVLLDVLSEVLTMQMANGARFLAICAAGAVIAIAISFAVMPPRYVSTAVLQATPGSDLRLAGIEQELLSRSWLAATIRQPKLDLYHAGRKGMDIGPVVEQMRHDLVVRLQGSQVQISFSYPDPGKAVLVTGLFAQRFVEASMIHNRNDARLWQQFRADIFKSYGPHAFPGLTDAAPPTQPTLSVVLPPTPPVKDWRNARLWFVPLGLALGAVAALALHWPRPALRFALYAAAGCAAAIGASLLTRPMYTSTAVLRISPAHIPESLPGVSGPSGADCVRQARQELLTDEGLTGVFVKRGFPFTVADVPKLRQRIQVSPISHGEFQITVVDSNRFRAKQMADQMVVYFMERNVLALRAADKARANGLLEVIHEHMAGESLEVLDPASLPEVPSSPDRLWFVAIGAAIGLILAVVAGGRPTTPSLIPTRNAASDAPSTPSSPKNISGPFTRIDRLIRMGY